MSKFLRHEPCDACGSSDAKGIFDDGHTYCWSCGKNTTSKNTTISQVENLVFSKNQDIKLNLPLDITKSIPKLPYQWLKRYGVTFYEIEKAQLLWSANTQMLIFPFYGEENEILCWQGRYFPARVPKVFTRGYPDTHILYYPNNDDNYDTIVVVEDCVSALKVSRHIASAPILGSSLSLNKAIRLSKVFSKLVIWLDADKYATAVKTADKYRVLFDEVKVIYTESDPKEYNTQQIEDFLK